MPVYPRKLKKGIRYYYKFEFQHKTYFSKCIYENKFEAKRAESKKLEEVELNVRNPDLFKRSSITLRAGIEERLDDIKVKRSIGYYKDSRRYFKTLLDTVGDIPVIDIKKSDIMDLLLKVSSDQQKKGGENYTVNAMIASFKALFNFVIDKHDIEMKNPCNKIKLFGINKKMKYIPTDEDIADVKALCDKEQTMLLDFALETGCRINEAINLIVDDVKESHIILYTNKSRNSNRVPRKVPRPISLDISGLEAGQRVFSRWSDTPKFLEKKVKALKQTAWNWHNTRHRFASLKSKEGLAIFELMSLLGHSNIKTTQNYLQLLS